MTECTGQVSYARDFPRRGRHLPRCFPYQANLPVKVGGRRIDQPVTVLETYGNRPRIRAAERVWIPGLRKKLPANTTITVPAGAIELSGSDS